MKLVQKIGQTTAVMDAANPKVIEWETLMATFQQVDADGDLTRKWQLMENIFQLAKQPKGEAARALSP